MKKTLVALAAIATTTAFAQSSVTIDGGIELGIVSPIGRVAPAGARLDAPNGNNQIRFVIAEDLGGGLRATAVAAMRLSPESGDNDGSTNGRAQFQGESTVGLAGGFGAVRLGRALTALQGPLVGSDANAGFGRQNNTANLATGFATQQAGSRNGADLGRTDAIHYNSPNIAGLTVAATMGLKTSASCGNLNTTAGTACANATLKNLFSMNAAYTAGPLYVWGALENNRVGDKMWALLGTYDLKVVKIGAGYSKVNNGATSANGAAWNNLDTVNMNFMAVVPVGAARIQLGYATSENDATSAKLVQKVGLGMEYDLSKRTRVYAGYGNDSKQATGAKSGYELGMRHTF